MQIVKEETIMTITGFLKTVSLISLLGATALIYAQEQHEDAKPQEARPEAQEERPAHQDEAKSPKQDEVKPPREQKQDAPKQAQRGEHPDQPAKNGQQAGHIPDDKFRAHFGRQHTVVIHQPTIVEGQPRFQYSGYWFTIVDAWPVGWAYTDDCYIDYIDGEYFLFDLRHPGVRVAIVVVL